MLGVKIKKGVLSKTFYITFFVYVLTAFTSVIGFLIDGAIIGQYLGVNSIAAYGIISPLVSMFALIGIVLSAGSRSRFTRLIGEGETKKAVGIFSLSLLLSLLIALFIMIITIIFANPISKMLGASGNAANILPEAASYLIGVAIGLPAMNAVRTLNIYMTVDGNQKLSVISTVAMTVTNIILDLVVIFVIHGNMLGMGLTTSISYYVAFLILLLHFKRKNRLLNFSFKSINFKESFGIVKTGLPMGICYVGSTIRSILMNNMLAIVASSGAVAAYAVQRSADDFLNPVTIGIADTVALMAGILLGEHDKPQMKKLLKNSVSATFIFTLGISIIAFFLAPLFASIYIKNNPEALSFSIRAVRCYAIGMPFYGLNLIYMNYLQGIGKSKISSILGFVFECGLLVTISFIMLPMFKQEAIWLSFPVTQILTLLICGIITLINKLKDSNKKIKVWDKALLLPDDFDVDEKDRIDISINSEEEVMDLSKAAWNFCTEHGCDDKRRYIISLAIEELGTNIIKYGFRGSKKYSIDLRIIKKDNDYIVRIRDNCPLFDPKKQLELYSKEDLIHHTGIRMAFSLAKEVNYVSALNLNSLLIKI